jgi:hypothetical protein
MIFFFNLFGVSFMSDAIRCPKCNEAYWVSTRENWGTCTYCGSNNDFWKGEGKPELVSSDEVSKSLNKWRGKSQSPEETKSPPESNIVFDFQREMSSKLEYGNHNAMYIVWDKFVKTVSPKLDELDARRY